MVGMGVAELLLLAMMTGGGLPPSIAFGNPIIALTQMSLVRSAPMGGAMAYLLFSSVGSAATMVSPPSVQVVPAVPAP
jgi:hypothetical protein